MDQKNRSNFSYLNPRFFFILLLVFAAGRTGIAETNSVYHAKSLYDQLNLCSEGIGEEAFATALTGYYNLKSKGLCNGLLAVADLSQASSKPRLYIIDVDCGKLLLSTYVAHGRNSGENFARSFSNTPESFQSSIGFYLTGNTYSGKHGLSLQLKGLERNFNNKAEERAIVLHGADYVSEDFIKQNGRLGRSQGCPAVMPELAEPIINLLKSGSCFFIYYPDSKYLATSEFLRNDLSASVNQY